MFDVAMGSFDSCEVCNLIGAFLLSEISKIIPEECHGLYRDDGIIALEMIGRELQKLTEDLEKLFSKHGFSITVKVNVQVTEFLDALLNVNSREHRPYRKPTSVTKYVHSQSNHKPSILREFQKQ